MEAEEEFESIFVDDNLKEPGITDIRWHDLRRTIASRLVMADVDQRTVQELTKDITMTLRYSHLSPGHRRNAVQRLVEIQTDATTSTRRDKGSGHST